MKILNRLIAVAILLLPASRSALAAPPKHPNILFVLIDDMGYADMTCYGDQRVHTVNLDRMAAEGIRFTQFDVNAPICSPSRTAFLTGQYPERWKITSYLEYRKVDHARGMADWLDPSAPTLARALHEAGYTTGHFGKWHMGGQRDVGDAPLITEYGFDKSLTTFEGLGDRILPLLDAYDGKPAKKYALGSDTLGHGHITWMERSKVTSGFVNAAMDFIKKAEADDKPFYMNVWPDDVHSPFFPPKMLRGDGSKKELYLGVVQATDDQLKPLFDLVHNDPKLRDNTLVIIASDNGPEPGAGSAGSFRGQKGNLYEGGFREPFITWGPGLLDKSAVGTVNKNSVIAGFDLFPSIMAIIGQPMPAGKIFDGQDMSGAMLGKSQEHRSKPLMWMRPPDRPGPRNNWPDLAIRVGDMKLLINTDGSKAQLYDLANDPNEKSNLAADNTIEVDKLKKPLLDWYKSLPVELTKPANAQANPDYLWWDEG